MASILPDQRIYPMQIKSWLFSDETVVNSGVKLPAEEKMVMLSNGDFTFPPHTIAFKTLAYLDPLAGDTVLETRLLILEGSEWKAASYKWNKEKSEAELMLSARSHSKTILCADEGCRVMFKTSSIRMPFATCNLENVRFAPFGINGPNLNMKIFRDNKVIDQLRFLEEKGAFRFKGNVVFVNKSACKGPSENFSYREHETARCRQMENGIPFNSSAESAGLYRKCL